MKFETGDEIDNSLVKVIVHEFSRCQLAFNLYINLRNKKFKNEMKVNTELDLLTYNAYALFIQHLYEYLLACITRDKKNTNSIPYFEVDNIINKEVEKTLKMWRDAIDKKIPPKCDIANDRSYYEDTCPQEFGSDFRTIRNNIVHADYRRIEGGNRILLSDFYLNYHKYVMLLYFSGQDWWGIEDYSKIDLGDVTDFNNVKNKK